ncbi:DNA primase [Salmonella enterica]|nr:DNA primase [Salmonella enterica]ELF7042685.1 DNA primase [Salmonella enterica]
MKARYRTWLAVPPDERDLARNAHPPVNGQKAVVWSGEHKLWYAQPGVELSLLDKWLPRPQNFSTNDSDPVTEFAQELENAGLIIKGLPVMDGALHRVPTKADKKGVKSGVYKAFLDGRPAGWYRDYRSGDAEVTRWVFSGGDNIDPLARLHLKAQAQQNRENSERELAQQYNRQAGYASRYVSRLPQATTSPYLTRKGVTAAQGVRINPRGELVIPFSNAQGKIRTYQRIPETGGKDARLLKDGEKSGNWFTIGTPVNGQPLLFAEGYATAASLHESTGLPVLMCIDAGNLIAVGQNARAVWPDSQFIFCADNDHHLQNPQTGEPENKGVISATQAAELSGGEVIVPVFTEDEKAQKLTDFNDLDTARGRDTFRRVINVQLRELGVRTDFQETHDVREAFTVGPLTFTPVRSEEQTMDNPTITGPETPAPALTETTAASLQPEIQPAPVADSTKPDNVVETTPSGSAATAATGDNDQASENVQKPPEALPPESETPGEYDDFRAYEEMMRSGEAAGQQQGASVSTAQSASPATAPAQAQTEGQNIQTPASSDTAESSVASRETADATTTPETRKPDSVAAETLVLPPEPSAAGAAAATAATDVFPASQDDWNAFAEDLSRPPSPAPAPASTQSQETSGDVPEPASAAAPVPESTPMPSPASVSVSAPEQPASVQDSAIQPPPVTGTGEEIARPETDTTEKAAETADTGEISASPDSTSSASAASESPAENNVSAHDPETATSATPAGTDNTAGSGTAAGTEKPGAGPAATPDAGSKADALPDTPAPASALLDRFRGFFSRRPKPQPADTPAASSAETVQEAKPQTAASSVQDVDGIVYGPRRPDSTAPENLDEIIKSLKWDTQPDNTVLYRLDDEPAFRDLGSRLEMVDGASQDDRKVLAALAVATKFYGGVIELTGSDEFKQKAMHLIVANNLEVRMKLPDQRAMLEKLRQERGRSQDTVVSHIPTPDLNRQTQTPVPPATAPVQAAPQPQTTTATATATSAASTPAAPPSPPQSGETTASASSRPQPPQSETPVPGSVDNAANAEDEAAPGKLRQGESVTAVLTNYGRAEYVKGKGESFFVELSNRSGRHLYWGQGLEELVKQCHKGEAVTLTLNGREEFTLPGDDRPRIRNKWSMTPVSCGITVPHERPEQGQRIQAYPAETFRQVMAQIRHGWPELTQDMRLPDTLPQTLYLGEDRQPVSGPDAASQLINVTATPPEKLAPVLGSLDKETRELNLLLVRGADEHLQGVVRLNGTLYPALATPSADNSQLVINALTAGGLRFAGYGQAVNRDMDSNSRPAPQLMQFHLKQREEPLFASLYSPAQQPDELFRSLGFEQTWQQWSDGQKPEGRQEKNLHQDLSHSPGR